MIPLLFAVAFIDTPAAPVILPRRPAVIRQVKPTAWKAKPSGTRVVLPNGSIVTTGPAEAKAATPISDQAAYDHGICLQLQAAQPWMRWGCPG